MKRRKITKETILEVIAITGMVALIPFMMISELLNDEGYDPIETEHPVIEYQETIEIQPLKQTTTITQKVIHKEVQFAPLDVDMEKDLQESVFQICKDRSISFPLVMAIIKQESQYNKDAIGDNGRSFGLMQVQKKWHLERMEDLSVTDILDPTQNVKVGTDYLIELFKKYTDTPLVLMAYNMGETKSSEFWKKGIYTTDYAESIMLQAEEYEDYIEGELE